MRHSRTIIRETEHYAVTLRNGGGARIRAKAKNVQPRSQVVSRQTWQELSRYSDANFNAACVLELGIGTFTR